MILQKMEIMEAVTEGDIIIRPFLVKQLNPNSYNLKLSEDLLVYDELVLDCAVENRYKRFKIPDEGLVLQPGILYLGRTEEYTETKKHVPMIEGRSSLGRLGIFIHITAGFGDVGFKGFWTLEISCVQPVRVYAGMEVCQIFYHTVEGEPEEYSGKYQGATEVQPSMLWKEFA